MSTEAELLARIVARPDDDAPRLVYADWLMAQGDPRGERIALHIAGRTGPSPILAGPLVPVIRRARYERGFLVACKVELGARRDLIGHPLWSTVREIDCPDPELVGSLPSVQIVRGIALRSVAEIATPIPVRRLECRTRPTEITPEIERTIQSARALPQLRWLVVRLDEHTRWEVPVRVTMLRWLLRGPLAAQLETLVLDGVRSADVDGWRTELIASPLHRLELTLRTGERFVLDRATLAE